MKHMGKDKEKKVLIRIVSLSITILFCLLLLTACHTREKDSETASGEVVIPVLFFTNPETGLSGNEELVMEFNTAYEGTYRIEVEWVTSSVESYREKLKVLNALDELPAVITDVGFDGDFYKLLVKNQRLVDLAPFLDGEWEEALEEKSLEGLWEEGGSIYLMPSASDLFAYAGFFYHKELLDMAGVELFPETWEEFFGLLEKLSGLGHVPMAMHGGESYWAALLAGCGYMAKEDEGMVFIRTQFPLSYQNPSMEEMLLFIRRLYRYADTDAVNIDHDESLRRFLDGRNLIYPDGYWIHTELSREEMEQIGFAPFPGNILMVEPKMSAWSITEGHDEGVLKGALAFLRFRTLWEMKKEVRTAGGGETLMEREYLEAVKRVGQTIPNYQLKWKSEIHTDFFAETMPEYLNGNMDEKEFLKLLDERLSIVMAK